MPIGQADLENAIREGWIRDEDNEVSIDGYNSAIDISTNDGTSGFHVRNSIGAVSFSAKSDGDGYFAKNLGVGTYNPETQLEVIGKTRTDELQVTTGAVNGYVLTSDPDGNATWQPTGAATSGVSETTFQENKNAQNEINYQILTSLDGYAQNSTVTEHYNQLSQSIQDIISTIDGYSTDTELAGLTNTVTENNNAQQQINQSVLQALDGYAIRTIEDQRWIDSSQQLQDIRDTLDADAYVDALTFHENKNAQEQINQSILKDLDGYETKVSAQENYTAIGQAIETIRKDLDGYGQTEQEHNQQLSEAILTIRKDLEDGYADISGSAADGYIAFFTGPTSIAGDNDLYFDRVNNQLQVSAFKLTTEPNDGYVLTSDSSGNATWQKNNALDESEHRQLDQLVHNIAEDSFEEYTYSGIFVTNLTVWTNSDKVKKIREEQFTYVGAQVSQLVIIQYNNNGDEVERITETYTYSGAFVTNISRSLT